ncbi:MAG TPA: DUF4159 domain-containing protein [Candidatus Limnocylindrales bacterium]|nr:DUF4159 domain-containing protein [Candidatus Limnocylindrales bacterium]
MLLRRTSLAALLAAGAVGALTLGVPGRAAGQGRTAAASTDLTGGFTIARLKYTGGGDWYSDETSLQNLLAGVKARGDVRVTQQHEAVVSPTDPDLWNYPLLFVTGHGNVKLSEEEIRSLRRYLDQGGLLWADDNFGMDTSFRELMRRVYPESPLVELPFTHELFRQPSPFPKGAPKVHEHDGGPARVFAIVRGGRVAVLYTFDCDIGNGIEDAGIYDDSPAKRDQALRFAVNIATYAVTH